MNAQLLKHIYRKALVSSSKILVEGEWLLLEDNNPKHTSKAAQRGRERREVKRINWPSQPRPKPHRTCMEDIEV